VTGYFENQAIELDGMACPGNAVYRLQSHDHRAAALSPSSEDPRYLLIGHFNLFHKVF
jgi:hypothetical protein